MKDRFGIDWTRVQGTHFWKGPHLGRRLFFRHAAAAAGGYFLMPSRPMETLARAAAPAAATPGATPTAGRAKNCIFILMAGGPSHADTFDLKEGPWTPAGFEPTSYDDVRWPRGLMPELAAQLDRIVLARSVKPWAAVHGLSQTWVQIARNPVSGLAKIAPHIGSVVSLELGSASGKRTLPAFLSLNTGAGPGPGYFAPEHSPFYVSPGGGGLSNTSHPQGQVVFERRYDLLTDLDSEVRESADLGSGAEEAAKFNEGARRLMYNAEVTRAFTFDANERLRYGNSGFGNACITARNVLRANLGTRFIQITVGGWDNHSAIYSGPFNAANANSLARQFDKALGTLMADLASDGRLEETFIVALGEFGRTVGALNSQGGRDHHLQQAVLFAGGGIRGRRAIGSTNAQGAATAEPGWSQDRDIRAEDVAATIYSALGIDWTTIRRDDPFGRGFEYVPFASQGHYAPIHELWG